MDTEIVKILSGLGAITICSLVLFLIAKMVFNRSKSDIDTLKVFTNLLTGALNDIKTEAQTRGAEVQTHGAESETRHMEILLAFQEHMKLTREMINTFTKSDGEIVASMDNLAANVDKHIKEVDKVGNSIMDKVTPLDQVLADIHAELKLLRLSVDNHLQDSTNFRNEIVNRTGKVESRLLQVEERITQESSAIPVDKPIEEKTHVQPAKQSARLDTTAGADSGAGGDNDGDTGEAVSS